MAETSIEKVLCEEAAAIHNKQLDPKATDLYRSLGELDATALCLSGGGIRSAAFGLGILQAFAAHPRSQSGTIPQKAEQSLLAQFHYLSTVSGGGYIGSWLSRWRLTQSFPQIWRCLVSANESDSDPRPISWLRSFTNYLTPRRGLTSSDTWVAFALWIRNLLLNWLVIITPLCAVILLIKFLSLASLGTILWNEDKSWIPDWSPDGWMFKAKIGITVFSLGAGVLFFIIATAFLLRNRPSARSKGDRGPDQWTFVRRYIFWLFLSAVFLVHFFASDLVGNLLLECNYEHFSDIWGFDLCHMHEISQSSDEVWNVPRYPMHRYFLVGAGIGSVIYCIARLFGRPKRKLRFDFQLWAISGAVYGMLVCAALYTYLIITDAGIIGLPVYFLHFVFGVPWLLLSQLLAEMLFVGLTSYYFRSDADREWFAKSAAWCLAVAFTWLCVTFLILFGVKTTVMVGGVATDQVQSLAPAIGAISGLVTAIVGKSSMTAIKSAPVGIWQKSLTIVLPIAAMLFAATLIIALSYEIDSFLFGETLAPDANDEMRQFEWWYSRFVVLAGAFAVTTLVALGASYCININRFSLHTLYRNRLVRAFLGASRLRTPDRLTGFDEDDNPSMSALWKTPEPGNWRPFHIINIALNLVSSERLSWQERKAAPFTVSPLHSGSSFLGYRATAKYGGPITLGTAMAISGAAASPNMGYHSSPAITFLMALFNVRLGWWLGNPGAHGKNTYPDQGPTFALKPLIQEAFGITTDDRPYVYLSDGGHFENLGLYEMVRRRCRYIVVADAGCDPHYTFEDLANATRKIAIDLGIQIRFKHLETLKPRPIDNTIVGPDSPYHAIAEIDYRSTDGAKNNGIILFIKAGFHGVENAGIQGYANINPSFPHQPTLDQWFSESQFESYRALGFEITDGILSRANAQRGHGSATLGDIMESLNNAPQTA